MINSVDERILILLKSFELVKDKTGVEWVLIRNWIHKKISELMTANP